MLIDMLFNISPYREMENDPGYQFHPNHLYRKNYYFVYVEFYVAFL